MNIKIYTNDKGLVSFIKTDEGILTDIYTIPILLNKQEFIKKDATYLLSSSITINNNNDNKDINNEENIQTNFITGIPKYYVLIESIDGNKFLPNISSLNFTLSLFKTENNQETLFDINTVKWYVNNELKKEKSLKIELTHSEYLYDSLIELKAEITKDGIIYDESIIIKNLNVFERPEPKSHLGDDNSDSDENKESKNTYTLIINNTPLLHVINLPYNESVSISPKLINNLTGIEESFDSVIYSINDFILNEQPEILQLSWNNNLLNVGNNELKITVQKNSLTYLYFITINKFEVGTNNPKEGDLVLEDDYYGSETNDDYPPNNPNFSGIGNY